MVKHSFMFIIIFIWSFYMIGFIFWALFSLISSLHLQPSRTKLNPQGVLFNYSRQLFPQNLIIHQNLLWKGGSPIE